ncbi:UDP binding domain-containing protein [Maribacter antarcticus]|uniref:UDP binding domain-containing protein n=1 Tax=Maribacter antarcticus TaxID=505250 RepID=UPI000AF05BA7|nr:UDP binding domain-containing protein [Maribacter antarcticus]
MAEASKGIKNTQRDINISFMNELAQIFHLMSFDTNNVLEVAQNKWNFLSFKPGLVGGHCIEVDPFYLAQKEQENGCNPDLILAVRRINDGMGEYLSLQIIKLMLKHELVVKDAKILVMGTTCNENCSDIRNTKFLEIIKHLNEYRVKTTIYDPWANHEEVLTEYDITTTNTRPKQEFDMLILAVAHKEFIETNLSPLKH